MTDVRVFAGPTLPAHVRPAHPRLVWSPPAQAGDALMLLDGALPAIVVLIDGLFDAAPAIRHKELLLLMSRGVRLYGASSMGALRACELDDYGMIGVGAVYAAYASGRLVADDEVALLHGPVELDWAALTVPLINVRATLVAARRADVATRLIARRLLDRARALHFTVRTWEAILDGIDVDAGDFAAWRIACGVDIKRDDALAAIERALAPTDDGWSPPPPPPATGFTAALASSRKA